MIISLLNVAEYEYPLCIISSVNELLERISLIPIAISSGHSGFTRCEFGPAASGIDETFDVITGSPLAKASNIGKPKPFRLSKFLHF